MIFAVLVSVVSVSFGVYKNFEAKNNHAFIYEQAYRIIGQIKDADIPTSAKNALTGAALSVLSTPPPVIDLSRSSAANPTPQACSEQKLNQCSVLASDLAAAHAQCTQSKGTGPACTQAQQLTSQITSQDCVACYTP